LQRSDCDGRDVGIAGLSDEIIEWGRSVEVWDSGAADTGGAGELAGGGAAAGDERVAVSRTVNRPATPSGG